MKYLNIMRKILYLIVCAWFFGACSSVPNEREVTVSNVDISGFIKDYIKVVDGTYKFMYDGRHATITIKVELIKKVPNFTKYGGWGSSSDLSVIDKDGNIFDDTFDLQGSDKLEDLLKSDVGTTKTLMFKHLYYNIETKPNIFTDAVTFEWSDKIFGEPSEDTNISSNSNSNAGSSDWDKVLSEYESFVDSYVKLIKKAQSGDVSALTESAEILTKANALSSKLSNAKGEMSASQAAKFVKLQSKIATAAM